MLRDLARDLGVSTQYWGWDGSRKDVADTTELIARTPQQFRDHHAIDPMLQSFAERANALLEAVEDDARRPDRAGAFLSEVEGLEALLHRHLTDEEELIVPVILKNGADGLH